MTKFAQYETAFGWFSMGYEDGAVVSLQPCPPPANLADLGEPSPVSDLAFAQLRAYFQGTRTAFDFPMRPQGSPFAQRVWQALQAIPYGETRAYKDIACAIGNPKASRAVGMANRKNPILIAIPCHRVIGASGNLTGYAGGLALKQVLLELEKSI